MAERLSAITAALDAFEAELVTHRRQSSGRPERGRLRGIVRALLPLALDDPTFDATVTVGPAGPAVRVQHVPGAGPTARLVPGPAVEPPAEPPTEPLVGPPAEPAAASPAEPGATAARALADLLRRGGLGAR